MVVVNAPAGRILRGKAVADDRHEMRLEAPHGIEATNQTGVARLAEARLRNAQQQVLKAEIDVDFGEPGDKPCRLLRSEVSLHGAVHRDDPVIGATDVRGDAIQIVVEEEGRREKVEDGVVAVTQVSHVAA